MVKDSQIKKVIINESREIVVTFKTKNGDWSDNDFSILASGKITGATFDIDFKLNAYKWAINKFTYD
jgi:hypothetical protein